MLFRKLCFKNIPKLVLTSASGFGLAELVTKLYEAAVKKVPNSEEYHSHLFMAYARVGEYKKMQQVWPTICVLAGLECVFLYLLFTCYVMSNLSKKLSWVSAEVKLLVGV